MSHSDSSVSSTTFYFFFFNATAPTDIYTLSLTTLFRSGRPATGELRGTWRGGIFKGTRFGPGGQERERFEFSRSEEHTSELQSHSDLVCRLLLEKKKTNTTR